MVADTYTVTLNANGGTVAADKDVTGYTYGIGATLPTNDDVTMAEHYFVGWYDNEKMEGDPISSIKSTDFGNKTYYAKWSENEPTEYLITFLDYDDTELQKGTVAVGATPTCTDPTRESDDKYDYAFEKWEPEIVPVTGIATYKAVYTKTARTYQITYNLDGGEFAETAVSSYTYGVGATLPTPTKEHYTFDGWYTDAGFTGTAVTAIPATETGNKNFYAKWTKNNEAEAVTVLDAFKDTVEVTKLVDTNTTITVSAKEGQTIPTLKMYRATYTAGKVLKSVEEINANTLNENSVFTFAPLTLSDGETSKVMLWSNNNPVINAITD